DLQGYPVYVIVSEDGSVYINKKNPAHKGYTRAYVDFATFHDSVLGEEDYYGYEYELQEDSIRVDDTTKFVELDATNVFSCEVLGALAFVAQQFSTDVSKGRGWA